MFVLHVICTRLRPGHLSVRVGDSSRHSEEIGKISNFAFQCDCHYHKRSRRKKKKSKLDEEHQHSLLKYSSNTAIKLPAWWPRAASSMLQYISTWFIPESTWQPRAFPFSFFTRYLTPPPRCWAAGQPVNCVHVGKEDFPGGSVNLRGCARSSAWTLHCEFRIHLMMQIKERKKEGREKKICGQIHEEERREKRRGTEETN